MSVEDLLVHFQYSDPDDLAPSDDLDSTWARQYFLPGDTLTGVVSLHLRGAVKVRALTLHLLGTASVSWEATHKKKCYQASEVHLDTPHVLLNAAEHDQVITLGNGAHQFGFKHQLPDHLPSTFIGVYGQVSYLAKVFLECEDERNTTVTSEPFMVLRRPDLPDSAYHEVTLKKKRTFIGLKTGKIRVECKIDKSAAVPGDDVIVDAEIMNLTGRKINTIQAAIMQQSRYIAQGHELMFRQYLSKRDDVYDVGYVHGRRWHKVKLPVPPFLADSGLDKCSIMDVKYFFQFKVAIEGKDDVIVETPLFVGSHHPIYGPSGRDLLLGRMWNSLAGVEDAPKYSYSDRLDESYHGGYNWQSNGSYHGGYRSNHQSNLPFSSPARRISGGHWSAYSESLNGDLQDRRFYRNPLHPNA